MFVELGHIGAIFDPSQEYPTRCADGTYSTSSTKHACSTHGGVDAFDVSPEFSEGKYRSGDTLLVPLSDILINLDLFQNREHAFASTSTQNIIDAVQEGNFKWEVFDPILLWDAPDGKLYILSGHSRTEAFRRMAKMGMAVDGRSFEKIPAKIIAVSQEEAVKIARESNTLSTPETDTERAFYYMKMREDGSEEKEVRTLAKRSEGSNWKRVLAYSFLNPNGKTFNALQALEGKDDTSLGNLKNVAMWIGRARQKFPVLSGLHEDELYDWLISGAYGKVYTRLDDFLNKVQSVIIQRTEFGVLDPDKKLNILNLGSKTPAEKEFDLQESELKKEIRELDNQVKIKLKELQQRGANQQDIDRIISPLERALRVKRQKLIDLSGSKARVLQQGNQQQNLFAMATEPQPEKPYRELEEVTDGEILDYLNNEGKRYLKILQEKATAGLGARDVSIMKSDLKIKNDTSTARFKTRLFQMGFQEKNISGLPANTGLNILLVTGFKLFIGYKIINALRN